MGSYLNDLSFVADNIVVTQDLDDMLPLRYYHVNALNTVTEQLRQRFTVSSSGLYVDISKIHIYLSLLRDNLGSDTGLTTIPLPTNDVLPERSVKLFLVLQKLSTPLSLSHITALATKTIHPVHGLVTSVTSRATILKNLFVDKISPLDCLYSAVSGGSSQPPTVILVVRLKHIELRLTSSERNSPSSYSVDLGFTITSPPLFQFSTDLVELQHHFKLLSTSHKCF